MTFGVKTLRAKVGHSSTSYLPIESVMQLKRRAKNRPSLLGNFNNFVGSPYKLLGDFLKEILKGQLSI